MKLTYLAPVVLVVLVAAFLAPALAEGPFYPKYEAPLDESFGKVIFNTNLEDDPLMDGYELEVEVEECAALANSTVNVSLDYAGIGELFIDLDGNGKETFYVATITNTSIVEVEGAVTLTSGDWVLWEK
jgi:hypothetical protein